MKISAGLNDYTDFSPIPPAEYEFIIREPMEIIPSADEKTDIGGKLYQFIVYPEVVGGEHAGRRLRRQFANKSKGSRYYLRSFLEKIGVRVADDGSFISEDLLGRKFKADVGERAYTKDDGSQGKANELDTESIVGL